MGKGSTVTAHYVYGVNRVSRDASGSYEYYHADGLGNTRQLSNDTQAIMQTTTYDAFGNIESSAGSSNNVYKPAGQFGYRNDGDDGLMHVGARDYDSLRLASGQGGHMSIRGYAVAVIPFSLPQPLAGGAGGGRRRCK